MKETEKCVSCLFFVDLFSYSLKLYPNKFSGGHDRSFYVREARVGARLVGGGGQEFYGGKFFHVCDLYSIREGYFLRVCFFFTPYGPVCMEGGREFCGCPSPLTIHSCGKPSLSHIVEIIRGVARIWEGEGQEFFFQIWKFACREAIRFARGVRGYGPQENFFKLCNLVRFGMYFDPI